ncbi:MAG: calcium/sodium antiporter [Planctomycetota bacterium]
MVRGSSRLAMSFGVSPLVVGLTVVAFGTSSPELAVSVGAALRDTAAVAVGNVVGSNIFNVLFILGAAAMIAPLDVHVQVVRQELPVMLAVSLALVLMAQDGRLGFGEGVALLLTMVGYTAFVVIQSRRSSAADAAAIGPAATSSWDRHWSVQLLLVAAGLLLLVLGAEWLVAAATAFARALGVSDLVIGLTVVAAGTSLPEVATSLLAAARGQRDIAVGNVVGSNVFNVLGCLGATATVAHDGLPVPAAAIDFDLWVMLGAALLCLPVCITGRRIGRHEGALFVALYCGYTAWIVARA